MPESSNWFRHEIKTTGNRSLDSLIKSLEQLSISGLEETEASLIVYYQNELLSEQIKTLCSLLSLDCTHTVSENKPENWNAVWESSFDPVSVDSFCVIYAHFHKLDHSLFEYKIQITPQMSFGTGHHETTRLMMLQMRSLNFVNKSVFDFGTGTGILAILSEMMGAKNIIGLDNMPWAVENAIENANTNGRTHCVFKQADHAHLPGQKFDIVLVNIIRKVILNNLDVLAAQILPAGHLLLSGYLQNDAQKMIYEVKQRGFELVHESSENKWVCQLYQKNLDNN